MLFNVLSLKIVLYELESTLSSLITFFLIWLSSLHPWAHPSSVTPHPHAHSAGAWNEQSFICSPVPAPAVMSAQQKQQPCLHSAGWGDILRFRESGILINRCSSERAATGSGEVSSKQGFYFFFKGRGTENSILELLHIQRDFKDVLWEKKSV